MIKDYLIPRRYGFTFIEILIALLICALLVGAVCTAMIHVLRLEKRTMIQREIPFELQTLACRTYLGLEAPKDIAAALPPDWLAEAEHIETVDQKTAWIIWRLAPADDGSLVYSMAIRAGLGPW